MLSYAVPAVVLYLHVAASFVENESTAVVVPAGNCPFGAPLLRTGGAVSLGGVAHAAPSHTVPEGQQTPLLLYNPEQHALLPSHVFAPLPLVPHAQSVLQDTAVSPLLQTRLPHFVGRLPLAASPVTEELLYAANAMISVVAITAVTRSADSEALRGIAFSKKHLF